MKSILLNPYFLNFFVPLVSTFVTVFVKVVSRNDRFTTFKKEDFAIGIDLSITALILFITQSVRTCILFVSQPVSNESIQNKVALIPWVIITFLFGIWTVSTLIRKLGWENEDKLNLFWGIIIPYVFGFISLFFVVNWIGG